MDEASTTRRQVLVGGAGLVGASLAGPASAQARSANAAVRIDTQHHALFPFWKEALRAAGADRSGGAPLPEWSVEASLAALDGAGVDAAVVSVSDPGVFFGDAAAAADLARRCNDALAAMVASHPRRYGALAVLPLPDVDRALSELDRVMPLNAFDGVILLSNVSGTYLGDPAFDQVFAELDRRGATVFVHPTSPPGPGAGLPAFLVDFPFDTTRAVARLITSGTAERCPRINFVLAHGGGAAPFLAPRLERTGQRLPREPMPAGPRAYLQRFHYDVALAAGPEPMAALRALTGPERLLFGSDWPYVPPQAVRETAEAASAELGAAERAPMLGGNALRLFPKLARRLRTTS